MTDAEFINKVCEENGIPRLELARRCGVSRSLISRVANGKRPMTMKLLRAIAREFKVDVREVV